MRMFERSVFAGFRIGIERLLPPFSIHPRRVATSLEILSSFFFLLSVEA